jgi:hypothetical protein
MFFEKNQFKKYLKPTAIANRCEVLNKLFFFFPSYNHSLLILNISFLASVSGADLPSVA